MSSLILPRRFSSQPQEAVDVDWNNPLTQGLLAGFTGASLFDATGRNRIVLAGTGAIGATDKGLALIGSNASASGSVAIDLSPYRGFSYSGWVYFQNQSAVGADDMVFEYTANINSNLGAFYFDAKPSSGYVNITSSGSGSYHVTNYATPTEGWHYVTVAIDRDDTSAPTQSRLYVDGVKRTPSNQSGPVLALAFPNSTLYLMSRGNSSLQYAGKTAGFAIHGRAINDSEAGELAQNNWQLYRAKPRVLYFSAGGGGGGSYTLTADTGAFTTTGRPVGFTFTRRLRATTASFTTTGRVINLLTSRLLSVAAAAFDTTAYPMGLQRTWRLPVSAASYTATPRAVGLLASRKLPIGTASFVTTGRYVAIGRTWGLLVDTAAYATTPRAVGLLASRKLPIGTAAFTTTGRSVWMLHAGETQDNATFTLGGAFGEHGPFASGPVFEEKGQFEAPE